MRLLVSVRGSVEARAALAGGADVIDAKAPARGALGPVQRDRLVAIRRAVGAARPVSAALGDARDDAMVAAGAAAAAGVACVKRGFGGVTSEARARSLARAARRGAASATAVVLVAYADWRRATSLAPDRLVAVAVDAGAAGLLLDTAGKDAPLFALESPDAVAGGGAPPRGGGPVPAPGARPLGGRLSAPPGGRARPLRVRRAAWRRGPAAPRV